MPYNLDEFCKIVEPVLPFDVARKLKDYPHEKAIVSDQSPVEVRSALIRAYENAQHLIRIGLSEYTNMSDIASFLYLNIEARKINKPVLSDRESVKADVDFVLSGVELAVQWKAIKGGRNDS